MYITFISIEFFNYKAIKHGIVNLDERGVLLIQGVNNDKNGSNGAGKSTIGNGLLWCVYDRTLDGKETEVEIIPKFISKKDFKKDGCRVITIFMREDIKYIITRHRKHPEFKNTVTLEKFVKDALKSEKLTKCTDAETNKLIIDIIGADYESFVHSNIFSFNNIVPFLSKSDKDKKELILPTFFVEKFKNASKNVKTEIKNTDDELCLLNNETFRIEIQVNEKKVQLSTTLRNIEDHNNKIEVIQKHIKTDRKNRKIFIEQVQLIEEELCNLKNNTNNINQCTPSLKEKIDEYQLEQEGYKALLDKKTNIENELTRTKLRQEQLKNSQKSDSITKLIELNANVETNTQKYLRLNTKVKELNTTLVKQEKLLENIFSTKHNLTDKIYKIELELISYEQNLVNTEFNIGQLRTQKTKVLTTYYSEECKTCEHNKIKEVVADINIKIIICIKVQEDLEKNISYTKASLVTLRNNKIEVDTFEKDTIQEINNLNLGELKERSDQLLIVSNKLHDLKYAVIEIKNTVDNADNVINELAEIQVAINKLNRESIVNDVDISEVTNINEINTLVSAFIDQYNTNTDKLKTLKETKDVTLEKERQLNVDIQIIDNRLNSLTEQTEEPASLNIQKDVLINEIDLLGKENISIEAEKKGVLYKLEILSFYKIGFGAAGIEGFMLDSILNNMNSLIAKYIGYLSNNTISLTLVPDKKLKSGETRNKISELVENESGGPTYQSNSSGEKRIMDIAILFTLKYIYEQITKTKYNLVFTDEVFDSLDAPTCALVINLLYSISDINSIFVISHSESLALEFEHFITMTKTRGITEITDEGI